MSYIKRLYDKQDNISLGLTTVLVLICFCNCGLLYIEDKTFARNYIEGDVIYTNNDTASKFIHCVSICIKKCRQPCFLISFTEGLCRCHNSYARKNIRQHAPNGGKTMYLRIAETNDGRTETTTVDTASSFESPSVNEEKPEYSSDMCSNTFDSCKTVSNGEYYIQVFNTDLVVTSDNLSVILHLTRSFASKFNFEHQTDGSYLIYYNTSITTNCFMYVNRTSMNVQMSVSSSPANQTNYYLEYQPEGSFKIRVKSLDYYIARSASLLQLAKEIFGDNGKFLIETTRPAWNIIFRIPSGSPYNIYQAFLYGRKQLLANACEVDTNGTCKYSFTRSDDLLSAWWNGCLSVCKIKLSLIKDNIQWLAFVFDGVNTSPETWFVPEKLQMGIHYKIITTNLSLTAVQSGDWFFKITDERTKMVIFAVHYENQTEYDIRNLTAVYFNNSMPAAEVQISVAAN